MREGFRETAVEARFDRAGVVSPRCFTWQGAQISVEGRGRTWEEGDERCFLVMAAGGRAFELRWNRSTLRWRVRRVSAPRAVA
jgi:hypothetical protein